MQFLFDNLSSKHLELLAHNRDRKNITAFGMCFFDKCLTSAALPSAMYVTGDDLSAKAIYEHMCIILGAENVLFLSGRDDVLLYKKSVGQRDRSVEYSRLYQKDYIVAVTCVTSLISLVPPLAGFDSLKLSRGQSIEREKLVSKLIALGFSKTEIISSRGEFTVRGDIVDIYAAGLENPVRLDFFDDLLENIKQFDMETKLSCGKLGSIKILPAKELFLSEAEAKYALSELKKQPLSVDFKAAQRQKEILDDIETRLGFLDASEYILPFLPKKTGLLDYISDDTTLIFDEPKQILDKLELLYLEHMSRFEGLLSSGEVFSGSYNQLLSKTEFLDKIQKKPKLAYQVITTANRLFLPDSLLSFRNCGITRYTQNINELMVDLKNWLDNRYDVVIYGGGAANNMCEQLSQYGFKDVHFSSAAKRQKGITVVEEYLKTGIIFHESKLVVIGTDDVVSRREKVIKRKKKDVFLSPEVGDHVVHPVHGIGICKGISKLDGQFGLKDFVVVEYYGGDTLYVPIDQMDLLSKYSGENSPKLNRIGGKEFEKIKARVRESVREIAFDLHKLYLERSREIGFAFGNDTPFQAEFEDAFVHTETEDQLKVVEEIKADMQSKKAMDRLLVGDVGYGKTEVAFRAAFKAVMDAKQVALLCPTTILSEQHYKTATERFKDFGVRIEVLNRFKGDKQAKDILKRLKSGEVDILLGTHRILGKDVEFNNLGLLIIDEEQRFGVEHKEKIKSLKTGVDVLSMSATPIPRTLHMSMVGIRDISVIETPPQKRLPIQSYVIEQTDAVVRDAVQKELARGGQVFVLNNRVDKIDKIAAWILELVPESIICKMHGQMQESAMEDAIFRFYSNRANVLVCTTIIENGIDLPNANTLIVLDSDKLGLSQLYQLRGRVGRSDKLAYCYFTTKQGKVLSEVAYKRLTAIMEFSDFGSGFKIAMRDLEIRGAGDVLGAMQHGHMDKVGYDMYVKLLSECVDELRGITEEVVDTTIDAGISAFVADTYISSDTERMRVYRRIADCASPSDKIVLMLELKDVYGDVPKETENLIDISVIKKLAAGISAHSVTLKPTAVGIQFLDNRVLMNKLVVAAVQEFTELAMLSVTDKIAILFKTKGLRMDDIIKNVIDFLFFCKKQ